MEPIGYQITVKSEGFEITVCGHEAFVTQKFKELEEKYRSGKKESNRGKKEVSGQKKTVSSKTRETKPHREDTIFEAIREKSIDRSAYPPIADDDQDLRKSLWILNVCEKENIADSLTAPQVARICTQKFKIKLSRQSARQTLNRAASDGKVNVVPEGKNKKGVYYQIMDKGTKYLEEPSKDTK